MECIKSSAMNCDWLITDGRIVCLVNQSIVRSIVRSIAWLLQVHLPILHDPNAQEFLMRYDGEGSSNAAPDPSSPTPPPGGLAAGRVGNGSSSSSSGGGSGSGLELLFLGNPNARRATWTALEQNTTGLQPFLRAEYDIWDEASMQRLMVAPQQQLRRPPPPPPAVFL